MTGAELRAKTDALVEAQALRDAETHGHVERVARFSCRLYDALELADEREREHLRVGALLHDVGKINTPDAILKKPGRHTDEETHIMRLHVSRGAAALRRQGFPPAVVEVVAQHHEWYDGTGYPLGLRWAEISLLACIFQVADALDAQLSDRCYRQAKTYAEARAELVTFSARQFDPAVVDAFLRVAATEWEELRRCS